MKLNSLAVLLGGTELPHDPAIPPIYPKGLNIMSSRFIHVVACDKSSFLFKTERYFIVFIYHILFIHLSVGEHLDCFHFFSSVQSLSCVRIFTTP